MIHSNPTGDKPTIARSAFVHPMATLIGHVIIGKNVFVGPQAVLRADEPSASGPVLPVVIESRVNIQDGAIVHALGGTEVRVGPGTSLSHGTLVHGPATIGAGCFVGFKSTVYNAVVLDRVVILHNALIEGVTIPQGYLVPSGQCITTEAAVSPLSRASRPWAEFARRITRTNQGLVRGYRQTLPDELALEANPASLINQALTNSKRRLAFSD